MQVMELYLGGGGGLSESSNDFRCALLIRLLLKVLHYFRKNEEVKHDVDMNTLRGMPSHVESTPWRLRLCLCLCLRLDDDAAQISKARLKLGAGSGLMRFMIA